MLQKTIPDLIIDARDLATADAGRGEAILGKRHLSDNKMLTSVAAASIKCAATGIIGHSDQPRELGIYSERPNAPPPPTLHECLKLMSFLPS